jgi:hypothetical protein
MGTALAGPKGERYGWRRIKSASATIFFIGFSGNVLVQIAHKPTNVEQALPITLNCFIKANQFA